MIRFINGPAAGQELLLERTPILLRVVSRPRTNSDGNRSLAWDALDQLSDAPGPNESIHLYLLADTPQWVHLDYQDKAGRRRGRTEWFAAYEPFSDPPEEGVLRDNARWQEWCQANRERITRARAARSPVAEPVQPDPPPAAGTLFDLKTFASGRYP